MLSPQKGRPQVERTEGAWSVRLIPGQNTALEQSGGDNKYGTADIGIELLALMLQITDAI